MDGGEGDRMTRASDCLSDFFVERQVEMDELATGVAVPTHFADLDSEHRAVRNAAGLFDFSFMSCFEFSGSDSVRFLNWIQTRNIAHLAPGQIAYTLLCRADGSVFIDATVWSLGDNRYWLFTGRRSDLDYVMSSASMFDIQVCDRSGEYSVMALQGPHSKSILEVVGLAEKDFDLRYFRFSRRKFAQTEVLVARIGYTGERGYELLIKSQDAVALWTHLTDEGQRFGLKECGFSAANSLRIEAGYILFANELTHCVTPYSLGYTHLVRQPMLHRFMGASGLRQQFNRPPAVRLVGLVPTQDGGNVAAEMPKSYSDERPSMLVVSKGRAMLTSLAWSPLFQSWRGMGYVHASDGYPGSLVHCADGVRARVARLPFFDPPRARARA